MRIACNGEIWQDGSFSIAGMLALQELVRRGHTIDFYNVVEESRDIPGVEVLTFRNNPVQDFLSRFLPIKIFHPINVLIYEYLEQPSFDQAAREASKRHAEQPYDALLFLGYPARFKIDGVPTVSWLQGAPQTEVEAFVRLKDTIISICGSWRYWQLRIAYKIKECVRSLVLKESDISMCPSSWSCEKLIENGTPKDAAYPLPYPIDLDLFKPLPASTQSNNSTKTLIWLGRSVPRKRLDLLMKSLEIVFEKHPDYRLLIVGHFSFTPEYSKLIENFTFKDRVEHIQGVARQDVPDLIRSSMLCVQPSEYENFGSAVAEALACGVASVIGPTNGTGDFTADACFRFDEYTVESLSETLLEAIETVEKNQQELAVKARKTAEENLELAKVVDRLEEILEIASQKHHS